MSARLVLSLVLFAACGCAELAPRSADAPRSSTAQRAPETNRAPDVQRALDAERLQNQLLAAELRGLRERAAERAELGRRLDDLARDNQRLAEAIARLERDDTRTRPPAAAPVAPVVDTNDDEIRRLRAQLANSSSFSGVTLTPAQVRALLRTLRPPRPIDLESPFAM